MLPNFGYQLHLASGEIERSIQSKEKIKQLLNGLYGGKGPNGEVGLSVREGVRLGDLGKLGRTRLMNEEMLEFYTGEYARNGMHGTREWSSFL